MQAPAPEEENEIFCSLGGEEDAETNGGGPLMAEYEGEDTEDSAVECNGGPHNGNHATDADLTAYRQRAREMLEELKADSDLEHGLGVLAVKLGELLEDLRSIDAPGEEMTALVQLLETIQRAITSAQLQQNVELLAQAERIVAVFAGIAATAP